MLYLPELFEPLIETPWEEGRVREGIRAIAADVERAYRGPETLWPPDPLAREVGGTDPMKSVYAGAAGTILALHVLERRRLAETKLDLPEITNAVRELFRARPDTGIASPPR